MRFRASGLLLAVIVAATANAQTTPPPPPPPDTPAPATTPAATPAPPLSNTASAAYERRDDFPNVNIYVPEGQASIRLRRLIRNVLLETQIDYKFVNGDISTFLRYKYYAKNYTYRLGVFDAIEFPDVGSKSNIEFERVRGGLLLVGIPRDYNNRYFVLLQDDRLTFGDLTDPDNRKNNIYTKIGYQYGTQFDERMNGIVGETRGRITPVLTAFRDIGPQKTGVALALTESARVATGDYKYTRIEGEALRRFDITATSFVFSRLHAGAFAGYDTIQDHVDRGLPQYQWYTIPRNEMFQLGGREALKSISASTDAIGTREIHLTNEFFTPIFRNRDYKMGPLHWNTMYGIGYLGAGSVAFDIKDLPKSDRLVVDAGLGTESAITIRDFDVYLSVVVAHGLKAPEGMKGTKVRFSIRTVR